jgi:thiol-disulfide isomerase/thioredoxin
MGRVLSVCLALACAGPVLAQGEDTGRWRRDVDHLIRRWSNDAGEKRVRRARRLLERRLRAEKDPEAMLELARLKLAAHGLRLADVAHSARLLASTYREAREHADQAASRFAIRDPGGKLKDKGGRRHHRALALGLLATQLHFQEVLRARRLGGSKPPELKALIGAHSGELAKRRKRLLDLAGKDTSAELLRSEMRRRETLRVLDRLGVPAPPLGVVDVANKPFDLSKHAGKVVLIVFWTTKIPECAELIKRVVALQKAKGDKLVVIGINLDLERATLDAYLATHTLAWRHAHGVKGLASSVARAWKVRILPGGVLLDHTGRVRYVRPWADGSKALESAVGDLLKRSESKG